MLLFTAKKGKLPAGVESAEGLPEGIKFAIYFNILAVIVLAEPAEHFSNSPSHEGPGAFGVDSIIERSCILSLRIFIHRNTRSTVASNQTPTQFQSNHWLGVLRWLYVDEEGYLGAASSPEESSDTRVR